MYMYIITLCTVQISKKLNLFIVKPSDTQIFLNIVIEKSIDVICTYVVRLQLNRNLLSTRA